MKIVTINCFKIAKKLSLDTIASYFGIKQPMLWEHSIVLQASHLEAVLKYRDDQKQVYLFDFGCISFVNFDTHETRLLIASIHSITGNVEDALFAHYHEVHTLQINDDNSFMPWKDSLDHLSFNENVFSILSLVLAKSVELSKIEWDLTLLLDESEKLLTYLQKGRMPANTRKMAITKARILRFEYEIINSIQIMDRSVAINLKSQSRELYDCFSLYYELYDRFNILEHKIADLGNITGAYTKISRNSLEHRLLCFEIFLLALFPLSYFVRRLFF